MRKGIDRNSRYSRVHVRISDEAILPLLIPDQAKLQHLGYLSHLAKNNTDGDLLKSFTKEFPYLETAEAVRIVALFLLYDRSHASSKPVILDRMLRAIYGIE